MLLQSQPGQSKNAILDFKKIGVPMELYGVNTYSVFVRLWRLLTNGCMDQVQKV